jgi:hypothetical protein
MPVIGGGALICEAGKKCPEFGQAAGKSRTGLILAVALVIAAILAVFLARSIASGKSSDTPAEPISTVAPTEFPIGSEEPFPIGEEQGNPTKEPDLGKPVPEVEKMLLSVSQAAQKYYEQYNSNVDYVSQNGLLYEYPSSTFIEPSHLVGVEGFDEAYAEEWALILFIKSEDIKGYLPAGSEEWGVYAAYETSGGYVAAGFGKTATIPKDEFKGILAGYTASSSISRIKSDTEEYKKVLEAIEAGSSVKGPFDVRYMETDGRYVSAVLSPKDGPLNIREYILQIQGTNYIIRIDKMESMEDKIVSVNRQAPDLNLEIVPPYELLTNKRYLVSDFANFTKSLKSSGMITEDDGSPDFISGNDEFVFIMFPSNLHLLCNSTGAGEWKVYPVVTYDEAVNRMKELSKFNPPPYFLIKQS